jgi:hypothetical protein
MYQKYQIDENIITGLKNILVKYLNAQIDTDNSTCADDVLMNHIHENNIYDDFLFANEIISHNSSLPAVSFHIDYADPEIRNNAITVDTLQVKLAVFTDGDNGAIIIKRYLAVLRNVIETYDKEISRCVMRAKTGRRRYFAPISYNSDKLRIAEISITVTVEVRK